jgi:hypothetical protein
VKEYAVIVPGARWDTKIWDAGNFGRLASLLLCSVRDGAEGDLLIAKKSFSLPAEKRFHSPAN